MNDLIRKHLGAVHRHPSNSSHDHSKCLVVEAVASMSVASAAGVQVGDEMMSVDGVAACDVDFNSFGDPERRHAYRFRSPSQGDELEFEASGAPLGVKAERSTPQLERQIKGRPGPDGELLDPIWIRGDWEALARAAKKSRGGWFARILGHHDNTPAMLMHGAALYEMGERTEGLTLLVKYLEKYQANWTTQYQAIGRYYLALELLDQGKQDLAIGTLREAFDFSPLERIADRIETLVGLRPKVEERFVGQAFPQEYELSDIHTNRPVAFRETVDSLQPGQVFWICLLANYRANGPYDEMMVQYRRIASQLTDVITRIHVITMEPSTNAFASAWLSGEEAVRSAAGLSINVLHDEGSVAYATQPTHSPTNFLVGPHGVVLKRAHLIDEVALWDAIADSLATN